MNAVTPIKAAAIVEAVIARGDLAALTAAERSRYYVRTCESLGLNPMTRPFEYITLNGKLTLYARKDATDQLRTLHKVSVTDLTETEREGVFIVTAKVCNAEGRTDAAKGAVCINGLKGEALANALMKAETKAKRRATLSICGLGFLDETEVEDIPAEAKAPAPIVTATKPPTKKDTKPTYLELQAEISAERTTRGLGEWREASTARIASLPTQWQMELSLLFDQQLADLAAIEAGGEQPEESAHRRWSEERSEQWAARQVGGLVEEIPGFLRRNGTVVVGADESWA